MLNGEVWRNFWWTVFVIELTDIAFAVDSILAAIGVVGSPPPETPEGALHPKLWVIIVGGIPGRDRHAIRGRISSSGCWKSSRGSKWPPICWS